MFIKTLFTEPLHFLMVCVILVFSICLHEYCHAWMAVREGDDGAAEFMTLNPLRQMGLMSLLMMALIGIAWGAVPVDLSKLRSRWSRIRISLAGPAANLVLLLVAAAGVFCIGLVASGTQSESALPLLRALTNFFLYFGIYNFTLMAFNLIPAPGLDGWNVLAEFFPRLRHLSSEFVKGAMLGLMILAFMGVTYLFQAGLWLMLQFLQFGYYAAGGA